MELTAGWHASTPWGDLDGLRRQDDRDASTLSVYSAVTHRIQVNVSPEYRPEQSAPETGRYFWSYTVTISNQSDEKVQLKSRYWKIIDALGRMQEVRGPGVVGEEPVIEPGASYEYTSGCPLATASGFMLGSYQMQAPDGRWFAIDIPAFSLDLPDQRRVMN